MPPRSQKRTPTPQAEERIAAAEATFAIEKELDQATLELTLATIEVVKAESDVAAAKVSLCTL